MAGSFWRWLSRRPQAAVPRPAPARRPLLECLESRDLLSVFHTQLVRFSPDGGLGPLSSPGPTGTSPAQIRHAYGIDQVSFANGTVPGDGRGTTIAIVDAYDDPNIANDLHQFDLAFGLPDPTFTKMNEFGSTGNLPAASGGWISEIALDVEWAHAIAPGASILLVEANSSSGSDLFRAVRLAAGQAGVVAVSTSWGGGEYGGETGTDSTFTTPSGHAGVTFVASSGDSGAPDSYPSASPNVLSVGGTTLSLDGAGNILSESGWSGSGGGISTQEPQPSYQAGLLIANGSGTVNANGKRANPDVAYDASPSTGFPVYDSYNNSVSAPWGQWGGTSDAAPQWAALIAIIDQGRALAGVGSLDGPSQTLPYLYGLPAGDFHDITSGGSTGTPAYSAGPGYDVVTGRGSPVANLIVNALAAPQTQVYAGTAAVADNTGTVALSAVVGSTVNYTFTVKNVGLVPLFLSDPITLPAGFTLVSDFSATTLAQGAAATFTVQINTATPATYSGTVSFVTSDPNNNPFTFTLTAVVGSSGVVDDGDASYSEVGGGWTTFSDPGYVNNATRYAVAGTGANTATWRFATLPSGWYAVQADWGGYSGHASNATYSIVANGATVKAVANQQVTSTGASADGVAFQTLATVFVGSDGGLSVTLSDNANGIVVADALRIAQVGAASLDLNWTGGGLSGVPGSLVAQTPFTVTRTYTISGSGTVPEGFAIGYYLSTDGTFTHATLLATEQVAGGQAPGTYGGTSPALQLPAAGTYYLLARLDDGAVVAETDKTNNVTSVSLAVAPVIDNSDPGYGETGGGWVTFTGPGYVNGSTRYALAGHGANTATWRFTGLAAGTYQVQADWGGYSGHAANAPYAITANGATTNVTANQQVDSSGTTVNGIAFQTLATVAVGSDGGLTVTLSDNANGIVVADALRVVQAAAPTIDLNWSGGGLSGVPTSIAAQAPFTVTRSYTISGSGTVPEAFVIDYYASPDGSLADATLIASEQMPAGQGPGSYTATSPTLQFPTAGTYYLLARLDDTGVVQETNKTNNVTSSAAVTVTAPTLVDNSDAAYSETGSGWVTFTGPGYVNGSTRYAPAGTGANTASWHFTGLAAGWYAVQADWGGYSGHASNAPYTLTANGTATTAVANQQVSSSGTVVNGIPFQDLSTVYVGSNGTLTVMLSDNANGIVVADAVRVIPATAVVLDNGTPAYGETGSGWTTFTGPGYVNGSTRYALAGTGVNTATWRFTGLAAGNYQVQADWGGYSGHASNAPYAITTNGATTNVTANQQVSSSGTMAYGVAFQTLATVTVGSDGTLTVTLSDSANGIVVADALRVVPA